MCILLENKLTVLSVRTRLSIRSINNIDIFIVKNSLKLKKTHAKLNLQQQRIQWWKNIGFRPIKLSKY